MWVHEHLSYKDSFQKNLQESLSTYSNKQTEAAIPRSNFLKKRLQHKCFLVNIGKVLRTAFFIEHFTGCFWGTFYSFLSMFFSYQGSDCVIGFEILREYFQGSEFGKKSLASILHTTTVFLRVKSWWRCFGFYFLKTKTEFNTHSEKFKAKISTNQKSVWNLWCLIIIFTRTVKSVFERNGKCAIGGIHLTWFLSI